MDELLASDILNEFLEEEIYSLIDLIIDEVVNTHICYYPGCDKMLYYGYDDEELLHCQVCHMVYDGFAQHQC